MPAALGLFLTLSAALAALGQVLLKVGATDRVSMVAFANPWIVLGFASYAASVVIWVYALSKEPLYAVYPFALLTNHNDGGASMVVFGERPSLMSLLGWGAIMLGLVAVYLGSSHA
jgi:drug/metabolite transporter (DMT)-like permease